jgi:hypothetical protein
METQEVIFGINYIVREEQSFIDSLMWKIPSKRIFIFTKAGHVPKDLCNIDNTIVLDGHTFRLQYNVSTQRWEGVISTTSEGMENLEKFWNKLHKNGDWSKIEI